MNVTGQGFHTRVTPHIPLVSPYTLSFFDNCHGFQTGAPPQLLIQGWQIGHCWSALAIKNPFGHFLNFGYFIGHFSACQCKMKFTYDFVFFGQTSCQ